jgi:hypothetical protein
MGGFVGGGSPSVPTYTPPPAPVTPPAAATTLTTAPEITKGELGMRKKRKAPALAQTTGASDASTSTTLLGG